MQSGSVRARRTGRHHLDLDIILASGCSPCARLPGPPRSLPRLPSRKAPQSAVRPFVAQPDDSTASTPKISLAELKSEADPRLSQTGQDQIAASPTASLRRAADGAVDESNREHDSAARNAAIFILR
jgi:hypothetical protein